MNKRKKVEISHLSNPSLIIDIKGAYSLTTSSRFACASEESGKIIILDLQTSTHMTTEVTGKPKLDIKDNFLAIAGNSVTIIKLPQLEEIRKIEKRASAINWHPKSHILAYSIEKEVFIEEESGVLNHENNVNELGFTMDGILLVTVTIKSVNIWDYSNQNLMREIDIQPSFFSFSHLDDGLIVFGPNLQLWNARNWTLIQDLSERKGICADFSSNLYVSNLNKVFIYRLRDFNLFYESSFLLPHSIKSIKVVMNRLIALHNSTIAVYEIPNMELEGVKMQILAEINTLENKLVHQMEDEIKRHFDRKLTVIESERQRMDLELDIEKKLLLSALTEMINTSIPEIVRQTFEETTVDSRDSLEPETLGTMLAQQLSDIEDLMTTQIIEILEPELIKIFEKTFEEELFPEFESTSLSLFDELLEHISTIEPAIDSGGMIESVRSALADRTRALVEGVDSMKSSILYSIRERLNSLSINFNEGENTETNLLNKVITLCQNGRVNEAFRLALDNNGIEELEWIGENIEPRTLNPSIARELIKIWKDKFLLFENLWFNWLSYCIEAIDEPNEDTIKLSSELFEKMSQISLPNLTLQRQSIDFIYLLNHLGK